MDQKLFFTDLQLVYVNWRRLQSLFHWPLYRGHILTLSAYLMNFVLLENSKYDYDHFLNDWVMTAVKNFSSAVITCPVICFNVE